MSSGVGKLEDAITMLKNSGVGGQVVMVAMLEWAVKTLGDEQIVELKRSLTPQEREVVDGILTDASPKPSTDTLLGCPFCCSVGLSVAWRSNHWAVECGDCEAIGPLCGGEKQAVRAWNKRRPSRARIKRAALGRAMPSRARADGGDR